MESEKNIAFRLCKKGMIGMELMCKITSLYFIHQQCDGCMHNLDFLEVHYDIQTGKGVCETESRRMHMFSEGRKGSCWTVERQEKRDCIKEKRGEKEKLDNLRRCKVDLTINQYEKFVKEMRTYYLSRNSKSVSRQLVEMGNGCTKIIVILHYTE